MKVLDIGCGQKKLDGAIGIDFSPYSMADIVLDLNKEKLPFEDNSIDYIYSSHTLEHLTLDGFIHIIHEMYRIIKPDGQICITVPYFMTSANLANPFHNNKICFNEHTFRFFSSAEKNNYIDERDYYTPSCPQWGLRYSANMENKIELQTIEIEYTYFDEYKNLKENEKRIARQKYLNVVDSITYYLKPIKPAPLKLKKTSKIGADSYESIVDEKLKFLEKQIEYYKSQLEYIKIHKLNVDKEENILSCNFKKYKNGCGLYFNEQNVLKPAPLILFQIQEVIDKNQKIIDILQQIIDENQEKLNNEKN